MQITGLQGKTALVTGSSKGIGRAIAIALAGVGANVVVNHRDSEAEALEVKEAVEGLGRRAIVVRADAGVPEQIEGMFERAVESFGGVDVAVHNALYTKRLPVVDLPLSEWRRTMAVCLDGGFMTAQLAARDMIRRGVPGSIVFISSIMAIRCPPRSAAYNSAKNGLQGLALTLGSELAPHRIRVNVIQPGWIDTPGERTFNTEEQILEKGKELPWGRLGEAEEIAKAVVYLASDLGSYVTGATLRVDGALSLPSARDLA